MTASAEIQICRAIEKYNPIDVATSFAVAPESKLYAAATVSGVENETIIMVFLKAGVEASRVNMKIPRTPYRTHAYKTMRSGDSGDWTVRVLGQGGAVLGSADFKVEVSG